MRSAVLLSGGLDSAVLLAEEATRTEVLPVYVAAGLAWEPAERQVLTQLLANHPFAGRVGSLVTLTVDMRDVYDGGHWAVRGEPPAYHTPDEDVYLPGRNVVLLCKASIVCAAAGAGRILLGSLGHNPFPDATPEFRTAIGRALTLGLAHPLEVEAPFADLDKTAVIRRGAALGVPFDLTLSCMSPRPHADLPRHCGACSKCRERHEAFLEAGIADPTPYADPTFTTEADRRYREYTTRPPT